MLRRARHYVLLAVTLVTGAGCAGDSRTTAPALVGVGASAHDQTATLLQCSTATADSATDIIGALGGTLSVGGTSVVIPANAVLSPTSFTLKVPASPYVEIEVTAGNASHFVFDTPVLVTIDYGRCGGGGLLTPPHQVWNIDPDTKALLEKMVGVDVQLAHTVVFTTIHFSGYAVAE